jgi:hypothetical protein
VWHNRNELWLGRPAGKAEDIGLRASQYVLEFIEQQTTLKVPDHQRLVKWNRPPIRKIKVNVVEKVFSAHQMGVGVVIQDADGEVLVALSEKFNEGGDGLWRITRAMWRAILLCWEMGFHSALVECTNASLPALLQSRDTCYTKVGWVLEDISHILRYLGCISFISLNNSCNNVAQTLAGFAKEKDGASVWIEEYPSFLFSFV